jgi:hypothetical protein
MIVKVECLRTLDRLRVPEGGWPTTTSRTCARAVYRLLDSFELVEPTRVILARTALPMPTTLGTLDAIRLATALAWREHRETELTMLTTTTRWPPQREPTDASAGGVTPESTFASLGERDGAIVTTGAERR